MYLRIQKNICIIHFIDNGSYHIEGTHHESIFIALKNYQV